MPMGASCSEVAEWITQGKEKEEYVLIFARGAIVAWDLPEDAIMGTSAAHTFLACKRATQVMFVAGMKTFSADTNPRVYEDAKLLCDEAYNTKTSSVWTILGQSADADSANHWKSSFIEMSQKAEAMSTNAPALQAAWADVAGCDAKIPTEEQANMHGDLIKTLPHLHANAVAGSVDELEVMVCGFVCDCATALCDSAPDDGDVEFERKLNAYVALLRVAENNCAHHEPLVLALRRATNLQSSRAAQQREGDLRGLLNNVDLTKSESVMSLAASLKHIRSPSGLSQETSKAAHRVFMGVLDGAASMKFEGTAMSNLILLAKSLLTCVAEEFVPQFDAALTLLRAMFTVTNAVATLMAAKVEWDDAKVIPMITRFDRAILSAQDACKAIDVLAGASQLQEFRKACVARLRTDIEYKDRVVLATITVWADSIKEHIGKADATLLADEAATTWMSLCRDATTMSASAETAGQHIMKVNGEQYLKTAAELRKDCGASSRHVCALCACVLVTCVLFVRRAYEVQIRHSRPIPSIRSIVAVC